tara:strand:+ start:502 stop:900 length:399 start_codon:yes stop_codon:yes gene_type:complete
MSRQKKTKEGFLSQRQLRVGELIRSALSDVLQKGGLRDPDLQSVVITVSEVRTSPDLKVARVFVMPLGGSQEEIIVIALRRAAPYLRREVSKLVRLKFAPELRFELDPSFDESGRIGSLLRNFDSDETDPKV